MNISSPVSCLGRLTPLKLDELDVRVTQPLPRSSDPVVAEEVTLLGQIYFSIINVLRVGCPPASDNSLSLAFSEWHVRVRRRHSRLRS